MKQPLLVLPQVPLLVLAEYMSEQEVCMLESVQVG
jgi:hypothetical protein